jgi:tRNA nucleotidyltransferase (CCA-adding enzyme)
MKTYLVGGAVRDKLLNYPVSERDWVVVGATVEQMEAAGYQQVGKDFPVFLHPDSKEEYALARTERKSGRGYTGFQCFTSPDITLEEDLKRRDLTINAMAEGPDGSLFDPYDGQKDIQDKLLRHVSDAFEEDPLRILRVARFYARYHHLGFEVASETLQLMRKMVASGMLAELVPERVWVEIQRSLGEKEPQLFFQVLKDSGGLAELIPAIEGQPQFRDSMSAMINSTTDSSDPVCRFSALFAHTTAEQVISWCTRFKVPNDYRELALLVAKYQHSVLRVTGLDSAEVQALLDNLDAFRRPQRFERFIQVCRSLATDGETRQRSKDAVDFLVDARKACQEIGVKDVDAGLSGSEIGQAISMLRRHAISNLLGNRKQ